MLACSCSPGFCLRPAESSRAAVSAAANDVWRERVAKQLGMEFTLRPQGRPRPLAEVEMSGLIRDLVQGAVKYDIEMPVEMLMPGAVLK